MADGSIFVVPDDVIQAARTLEKWAAENGHKNWGLMGVCDRAYLERCNRIENMLKQIIRIWRTVPPATTAFFTN